MVVKKMPSNNNSSKKAEHKAGDSHGMPEVSIYKYSCRGKTILHEATIIAAFPMFLTIQNGKPIQVEKINEARRILIPPVMEEYAYDPYEFSNMQEVESYFNEAQKESYDSLLQSAKSIVAKYNDQDEHKVALVAIDIVWSYFQDKFSTTHYLGVIGDNGSGKSSIGDTFEAMGYRSVNMTDPTSANLFRLLGKIEAGQCTIVCDEADKIDQSQDIMSTLKTGYQIKGKVARVNMNTGKQEFFWTYCYKMIIAEK